LRYLLLLVAITGCIDPIDARWQLDHDHVIVARATPPRVREGEGTNLDALVAHEGQPVSVEAPQTAEVAQSSANFARYLTQQDGSWVLHAPDARTLAAARPALGIDENAPVPVEVVLTFPHGNERAGLDPFHVRKTVWLGEPSTNPALPAITVDGAPAPDEGAEVVLPIGRDVYLSADAGDGQRVNWLTNVGTLFQDDVATSFLRVAPSDNRSGELVVVVRDREGGVAWRVWPVRAE
jgi:hypothetical protein